MRLTLSLLVLLFASPLLAVSSGVTVLPVGATDKQSYAASMAISLSVNGGLNGQNSAYLDQHVRIVASIAPDPLHVGKQGDLFVVDHTDDTWTMLTAAGTWAPWNGQITELQPARDNELLAAEQELVIIDSVISVAGEHRLYVGYLPADSNVLVYTTSAAVFNFSAAPPDAAAWFEDRIFTDIVMAKCSLCHVDGGVADASRLHFIRNEGMAEENFDIFADFYAQLDDGKDYVLGKASGSLGHTGGIQLQPGSTAYQDFASFLDLLEGGSTGDTGKQSLFSLVDLQDATETLRDGALLLAGRLPTKAETELASNGPDSALGELLIAMMQGPHFHDFLKDGANDRLHLRGNEDPMLADDCPYCYPGINAEYWRLRDQVSPPSRNAALTYLNSLSQALIESPLELIAHVVENNRPYTEILTADYAMLTPALNAGMGGTAVFAADAGAFDFEPGHVTGYYFRDPGTRLEFVAGAMLPRITTPSAMRVDYPHAGILNSQSFLSRYPTTATNRNRARARWTWYHFLGVDIEAQAKRTTDPVALADTNNPTMNNPACTVCHTLLDPLAGTFQDYADNGTYRTALNGTDSLDRFYKSPRTGPGLYQNGDLWYRDMRDPGFEGAAATGDPMIWLAGEIAADRRFATATVRFWWPAVMGAELLAAPEASEDPDYAARLAVYEAQQLEIESLAAHFRDSGLNLKVLLADLVMSPWFRAQSRGSGNYDTVSMAARELAPVTEEKLLTPEQLARKTRVLTGFNWNAQTISTLLPPVSGLENDYSTFYGGIDGFALKTRARLVTPMMANVAVTHALEAACPVVLGDFIRPDNGRLLFDGLSPWTTPMTIAATSSTLTSTSSSDFQPLTLDATLGTGKHRVVLSLLNDSCDWSTTPFQCRLNKNLVIDKVSIRSPNGQTTSINGSSAAFGSCAAGTGSNDVTLFSSCTATFDFETTTAGSHVITATLAGQQTVTDPVMAGLNVEVVGSSLTANTAGSSALRNKMVELHAKLLGQNLEPDAPEINASMDLLAQTWQKRTTGNFPPALFQSALSCDWQSDIGFVDTLGYPGNPVQATNRYRPEVTAWLAFRAQDPLYMKQSWVVVMAYLLSHYDYLHE